MKFVFPWTEDEAASRLEVPDVYSSFSPMFQMSRWLGVFPFRLNRAKNRGKGKSYRTSKFAKISSALLHLSLLVIVVLIAEFDNEPKFAIFDGRKSTGMKYAYLVTVNQIVFILGIAGCLAFSLVKSHQLPKIFERLSTVDKTLAKLSLMKGKMPKHRQLKTFAVLQAVFTVSSTLSAAVVDYLRTPYNTSYFLRWVPFYAITVIALCLEQQFLLLVMIFRDRFSILKEAFGSKATLPANPWIAFTKGLYLFKRRVGHGGVTADVEDAPEFTVETVERLRMSYSILVEDLGNVNRMYEPFLLTDIILLLFGSITSAFYSLSVILENASWGTEWIWFVFSTMRMLRMSWVAWDTVEQLNEIGPSIAKCMNTEIECEMNEELSLLLAEVSQYEFQFDVFGLFTLDMGFFQSVVETATSYLLILIQFPLE